MSGASTCAVNSLTDQLVADSRKAGISSLGVTNSQRCSVRNRLGDAVPGKRAGKTEWAGRRRPMTRKSGYNATAAVRIREMDSDVYLAAPNFPLVLEAHLPATREGGWFGLGGYFMADHDPAITVDGVPSKHMSYTPTSPGVWAKFGTLLRASTNLKARTVSITFTPEAEGPIALYGLASGNVKHAHLDGSRSALLKNMHTFAPEANFYAKPQDMTLKSDSVRLEMDNSGIWLKSCNRCGRYLPVNLDDERRSLSFSNHCIARSPCIHSGFGRIPSADAEDEVFELTYGFQLECRFCKKFEVNAALNPLRTASQMKEDGARRRNFELLLEHLYQGSPQLRYRSTFGSDLTQDVWERFDRRCFKCKRDLSEREMNLDHTRPLAMLWPLDQHATCLCKDCNSEKRDRSPVEFYTESELKQLAAVTELPIDELRNPHPNIEALQLLATRIDWLYAEFLERPELRKIRDGKKTGDLVIKALNRVIDRCPDPKPLKSLPATD